MASNSSSSSTSGIIKTVAIAFVAIPAAYYSYAELSRGAEIRKRKKRWNQTRARRNLEPNNSSSVSSSAETPALDAEQGTRNAAVDDEEMEDIKARFGSCVIAGRWVNPNPEWREQGVWEWLVWKLVWQPLNGKVFYNGGVPNDLELLRKTLPVEKPDYKLLFGTDPTSPEVEISNELTFTWIGQSTCFIQLNGIGILTDPVFNFKTVDTIFAPPRLCPPPCELPDLIPAISLVLVSHDHFDHIHPDAVKQIGNRAHWVVPLGLASFIKYYGVHAANITELDWWQERVIQLNAGKRVKIVCTPAQHWTARSPWGTNQSLWCSFVVQSIPDDLEKAERVQTIFHAGDTGYTDGAFKAIGRAYGPFDLALLPIGSYIPRWHMKSQHCNPEDAVKIHLDLRAKKSIGVHHGTWILSDEHYLDPPKDLALAREKFSVAEEEFCVVRPGKTLIL